MKVLVRFTMFLTTCLVSTMVANWLASSAGNPGQGKPIVDLDVHVIVCTAARVDGIA